ncbi:hypothetical protein WJX73_006668 [Symbiochloris irregularis]|uniref:Uncharacterized protein n=1 Tax=Symbiochloris irregularis TaxID=706552 RepID=A0AAW1PUY2_9CHLO
MSFAGCTSPSDVASSPRVSTDDLRLPGMAENSEQVSKRESLAAHNARQQQSGAPAQSSAASALAPKQSYSAAGTPELSTAAASAKPLRRAIKFISANPHRTKLHAAAPVRKPMSPATKEKLAAHAERKRAMKQAGLLQAKPAGVTISVCRPQMAARGLLVPPKSQPRREGVTLRLFGPSKKYPEPTWVRQKTTAERRAERLQAAERASASNCDLSGSPAAARQDKQTP